MKTALRYFAFTLMLCTFVAYGGERQQDMKTVTTSGTTACASVPYGPFTFWCTEDVYYALCQNSSCTVTATSGVKWLKDGSRDTSSTNNGNYFCAVQVSAGGTCVVSPFTVR